MKKILYCLAIIPFLLACQSNDVQYEKKNKMRMHSSDVLYDRLNELSETYANNNPNPSYNTDQINELDPTRENNFSISIAKEDMTGYAIGAGVGGLIGGAAGGAGGWLLGNAPGAVLGGALGTLFGAVVSAIPYSLVWSIAAIQMSIDEPLEPEDLVYSIDYDNPIRDFSTGSVFFDSNISYANVGYLHNYVISEMYNSRCSLFTMSQPDIVAYLFENVFEATSGHEDEYAQLYDRIYTNIESDYADAHGSNVLQEYDEYIDMYFDCLDRISECAWFNFTEDYMRIVDEELNGNDEERLMLINGSISTFFYSKSLWNTYAPSINSGTYIVFNIENGSWELLETDAICELYTHMLSAGNNILVFVPRIVNNELTALFLYDSISDLLYPQSFSNVIISDDSVTITSSVESLIEIGDSTNIVLPIDTYSFQRIENGYVLIFEE